MENTNDHQQSVLLPEAERQRWQPIRGGLFNIYRYDYQEFRYAGGRLVLRGNNGTGKSRVLALQLPFLLDGEIAPQRVEPDGDSAKRMEWNLLLGGKYDDRLGYTWLEFGRREENGDTHYLTIGCALRAVFGRGIAQQWFFITSSRIGRDLFLQNEQGQPLTKAKLEAAIGDTGRVFGTGRVEDDRRDYRRAVDKALFQLGDRYGALLDLLIQLRQPQLSRKLNEQILSDALSLALPPLPENVLGDVAEAFRNLENDRQELLDFSVARESSITFLTEYRRYIQIAARRRAEEVRKTHSAYESVQRRLREQEAASIQAQEEMLRLSERLDQIHIEEEAVVASEATLLASPEMKSAEELEGARLAADGARSEAESVKKEADAARSALARETEVHARAIEQEEAALRAVWDTAEKAKVKAEAVDLSALHQQILEQLHLPDGEEPRINAAIKISDKSIERLIGSIAVMESLNEKVRAEQHSVFRAQDAFSATKEALEESEESEKQALAELENKTSALFTNYRLWLEGVVELQLPDIEAIEDAFSIWRSQPQGDSPVARAIQEAHGHSVEILASLRADTKARHKIAADHLESLRNEKHHLETGQILRPPVPYTRDPASRQDRTGAPFWAVCDFHPSVPQGERAGIEAALEGSGFLDAWITPDGHLLDSDTHDTVLLAAANSSFAPEGCALNAVLQPDPSSFGSVSESIISAILCRIGYGVGAGNIWIDRTGQWQIGPLHGSWSKPQAQYIGYASREAARQQRLKELNLQITDAEAILSVITGKLETLATRAKNLQAEVDSAPTDGDIRHALAAVEAIHEHVANNRNKLTESEGRLTTCRQALANAKDNRDRTATDLSLFAWVEKLSELRNAIQEYRLALKEFWPIIRTHITARLYVEEITNRLTERARTSEAQDIREKDLQGKAAAAVARLQTLESVIGATVADVWKRLDEVRKQRQNVLTEKKEVEEKRQKQFTEKAIADAKISDAKTELEEKEANRKGAIAGLVAFTTTGQLRVAHDDFALLDFGSTSITRVVELAREIEAKLQSVDHSDTAWNRNQASIHQHFDSLQTNLRAHGHMPEGSMTDGIFIVSIQFQGRTCTIADLRNNLTTIIAERQELLDAREREILENYLIDEIAEHLHARLHYALRWKEEANKELGSRPMDTGMTLRFTWEPTPDSPTSFVEARRLLLSARGTWSPTERAAVGVFLQQQIKAVRAANETGTWQDHLSEAFDYRKWHQFGVERRQDGVWKRLTKKTHGTGSGGEKAIALTLPQLAAAAAHYRSAGEFSPRLILLDEAFVGVDKNMRAKCLDLLCAFDLDVVMTSESEWACYPTVPAIAIYQLSARDGIDAVHASRWVWNGRQRLRDDTPLPSAQPPIMAKPDNSFFDDNALFGVT